MYPRRVAGGAHKDVQSRACTCPGTDPVACVLDDEAVTQWSLDGSYTISPRPRDVDNAVSVVRGALSPAEAFEESVGKMPAPAQAERLRARHGCAGTIRRQTLAVVHTPGRLRLSKHVSVIYPADDPLRVQDAAWPADVSNGFDSCFNDARG